jgi:hypothetical protein
MGTKDTENIQEKKPTGGIADQDVTSVYDSLGQTLADEAKTYQEAIDAKKQRVEDAKTARDEAIANKTSVLNTIFEEYKPKYDEDKEKRLRQRAVIQSLGDMLSAAAVGVNAYGKRGMGYVPQMGEGSHLKSLEEINRQKEEYRKANEAWKEFEIKRKIADEDAKVSAADALLTAEKKDYDELVTQYSKVLQNVYDLDAKKADALAKSILEDKEQANRLALEDTKYAHDVALEKTKQGKDNLSADEEKTLGYLEDYYGDNIYGEDVTTVTRPYEIKRAGVGTGEYEDRSTTTKKSRKRSDLKKTDLQSLINSKSKEERFRVYKEFRDRGYTHEQALVSTDKYFAN